MLKKLICVICFLFSTQLLAADEAPLRLFIWENYFPAELLTEFKDKHGVKVEQIYYETDELKDETLINTKGGQGLDLIVGSRASFKEYAKHGWLLKYQNDDLKNLSHIDERWMPQDALSNYSLPYLWGTVGIAYRKDKVAKPIETWSDLFQPEQSLNQKIMMIEDSRDTIGLALKSLGFSINSTDKNELKAAKKLLLAQKPFVKTYSYPELDETSSIVTGGTWATMIYNGDAILLKEFNENIEFVVPKEGTNLWVDDIAVLRHSNNQDAALKFIDFINEPMNAAKIAQYLYYATPNKSAKKHLEPDFIADNRIYPSEEIMTKSEFFKELSPKQLKKRNDIFLKLVK